MGSVFNRAPSVPRKTFGNLVDGQFFRLDGFGGGAGSYFLKVGDTEALWIWTAAQTAIHTGGPVKAGSRAHFDAVAPVTPASFSPADGD